MSIEIRDAEQKDLDYVRANPLNEEVKRYPPMQLTGWAKTCLIDNEIMGVGGCVVYWKGVGEAWIQLSKNAEKHKIQVVCCMRRFIDVMFKELELHRLQATERADMPQTIKMAESFGFEREKGPMRKYAPDGGDVWLYAIVR